MIISIPTKKISFIKGSIAQQLRERYLHPYLPGLDARCEGYLEDDRVYVLYLVEVWNAMDNWCDQSFNSNELAWRVSCITQALNPLRTYMDGMSDKTHAQRALYTLLLAVKQWDDYTKSKKT